MNIVWQKSFVTAISIRNSEFEMRVLNDNEWKIEAQMQIYTKQSTSSTSTQHCITVSNGVNTHLVTRTVIES